MINKETILTDDTLLGYQNTRWKIERDFEEFGLSRLYYYFNGNATAIAEFLGFQSHDPVCNKLRKYGLDALGREKPRLPQSTHRSAEELDKVLLERSLSPEYAYVYDWTLPKHYNVGRLQTFADIHLQSKQCKYHKLKELIQWVKERPNVRWIAPGDIFDLQTKQSVGNLSDSEINITEALDLAVFNFEPIKNQCIGIGHGNHDGRILRDAGVEWNPVQALAKELNVPYIGYHKHMIFKVHSYDDSELELYTIYYHHGKGASSTKGGKLNAAHQIMQNTTAELTITAHNHFENTLKDVKKTIDLDTYEIKSNTRRLVSCPSFLDYGGYAEEKGLPPESTGTIGIEFSSNIHKIRVIE